MLLVPGCGWAEVPYRRFVQPFFGSYILIDGVVANTIPMSQAIVQAHVIILPLTEWNGAKAFSQEPVECVEHFL